MSLQDNAYQTLIQQVSQTYLNGQAQALQAVNYQRIETYWYIGQHLVEFEQNGQQRAQYGQGLLKQLAQDLTLRHGKGFSRSNLIRMRQFCLAYLISSKPSHKLSWSHYVELLKLDDPQERGFYQQQAIAENWSVPELKPQKQAQFFLRFATSKDKPGLLALAYQISETQLETALCDHLQPFLLELGKGFTFVGRQYRITLNNRHYKVDLVFYHRILRCFVLIDLKLGEVQHQDIGQMNMYLGYFANEENVEGDNPPIGLILSRQKDELMVEYATYNMDSQLFVQKYQLYLPDRDSLQRELELALAQPQAGEEQ